MSPRTISLAVLAFALLAPVAARSEQTQPMTLEQVVERARSVSPRVAQLRSLETAAREGERFANAGRMPQLDLSAGYSHNSDVPEFATGLPGRETVIFPNIPDNWRTRAAAQVPLYTGGRVSSSIDAAKSGVVAAGEDIVAGDKDTALEAAIAYWSLVNALESERVLTASLASFEQHLVDAQNRFDLGFAARNELLAVQAERDRAELQRLRARNAAEVAHANLLRLLDYAPEVRVVPAEMLDSDAKAASDVEPLVFEALAARAELKALRARIAAADSSAGIARSSRLPQASLAAAYDYAKPNQKYVPVTDDWKENWSVGVGVSWTPFDGGRSSSAEARARAEAEALRSALADGERRVRLEVTQRTLDIETSVAAVEVSKRGLDAAKENERVSRDRYQEGVLSSSELLDAETQTQRAALDVVAAKSSLRVSEAQLARAVGR